MNIYEKEIYSNLILTIEHFIFYEKKLKRGGEKKKKKKSI